MKSSSSGAANTANSMDKKKGPEVAARCFIACSSGLLDLHQEVYCFPTDPGNGRMIIVIAPGQLLATVTLIGCGHHRREGKNTRDMGANATRRKRSSQLSLPPSIRLTPLARKSLEIFVPH
jgi:hypothetical protein